MWWPDPKGTFTVKSTYKLANTSLIDTSSYHIAVHWLKVWNIKAPPTIIFFGAFVETAFPHFCLKGVQCSNTEENARHLVIACPFTVNIWQQTGLLNLIIRTLLKLPILVIFSANVAKFLESSKHIH
jgi:hypothetical protein